jgi:TctA family transporter
LNEIASNIALGFDQLDSVAWLLLLLGVLAGVLLCALPGVSAVAVLAIALPATFALPIAQAVATYAGLYVGCTSGLMISAIFAAESLQSPAAPKLTAARRIARSGRPMLAVMNAMSGLVVAAFAGVLLVSALLPSVIRITAGWGPAEFLVALGIALFTVALQSNNPLPHSFGLLFLGMLFGLVGIDVVTGAPRMTFGMLELMDGVSVIAAAIGLFAVGDIIYNIERGARRGIPIRELDRVRRSEFVGGLGGMLAAAVRGSAFGIVLGLFPGSAPQVASRIAVSTEAGLSRGSAASMAADLRSTTASSAASGASLQSTFLVLLCLGIPGSAAIAVLLLMMNITGLSPGPVMFLMQPEISWMIVVAIFISTLVSVAICIGFVDSIRRLSMLDYRFTYPAIFGLCLASVYASSESAFDVYVMCVFGAIGYILRTLNSDATPLLLGMFLIFPIESNVQRTLILGVDAVTLLDRLGSYGIILIPIVLLLLSLLRIWQQESY